VNRTSAQQLVEFLTSAFSSDELRRFIIRLPEGTTSSRELPGSETSPAQLAFEVVHLLGRRGMLDEDFFASLMAERPQRARDIRRIADVELGPRSAASSRIVKSSNITGERASIMLIHGDDGLTAAEQLQRELARDARVDVDLLLVHIREWVADYAEPPTAACLVLCTPGLFDPAQHPEDLLRSLRAQQRLGELRVIPVLVTATAWRTTPIGRIPPLPANSVPVSEWHDPDAAWADIVHGIVRAITHPNTAPAAPHARPPHGPGPPPRRS
jgi:hypothetical protein